MDDSTPTGEWPEWQNQPTAADPDTPVEQRFLLRLRDHPDDLEMRLVFADWLEETGQLDKAEIVRMLAGTPGDDQVMRLAALAEQVEDEWLAIVTRTAIEKCAAPFTFKCPKSWESLAVTDDALVRHCNQCERAVFFCSDLGQVRRRGEARQCVAFSPKLLRVDGMEAYEPEEDVWMGDVDPSSEWLDDAETAVRGG